MARRFSTTPARCRARPHTGRHASVSTGMRFRTARCRCAAARTGAAAASYELDLTDSGFRFPQTWRTSIGVDRRLPWGLTGTVDYAYNRDLNDPVYLNANLPAAQSAVTGVDARPRWVGTSCNAATA